MKFSTLFFMSASALLAQDWKYELLQPGNQPPSARIDGTIVYDPNSSSIYLFGGQSNNPLNDLWVFSLSTSEWKMLEPSGALPAARFGHTLVTDSKRNRLILFGGQASGFFNDVWAFDLKNGTWNLLASGNNGPSQRYGHSAVMDPDSNQMIISHGFTNSGRFDDTWAFDLVNNAWRNLTPAGNRPLRRCLHHAVLDPGARLMYLYGGCASGFGPCPLGDLWAFDLNTNRWAELTASIVPAARQHYGFSYDIRRSQIIVFGGNGRGLLSDTWLFDTAARKWNQLSRFAIAPTARYRVQGAYSQQRGLTYFFGGDTNSGPSNELWTLSSGLAPQPYINDGGLVNAFSGLGGAVAPGELISLFGDNLGPDSASQITLNGTVVPPVFLSNTQINLQVPLGIRSTLATFRVVRDGEPGNEITVPVVDAHPGIFPNAVNEDGKLNAPQNPSLRGSMIVVYATGHGTSSSLPISLELGGVQSQLLYSAASPVVPGLLQIHARVPELIPSGAVPIKLRIGSYESQPGVKVFVR